MKGKEGKRYRGKQKILNQTEETKGADIMEEFIFTKIHSFDRYNPRANRDGYVSQWRVETTDRRLVGIADTKREAIALARKHKRRR